MQVQPSPSLAPAPPPEDAPVILARDLTKQFGDFQAVRGIAFDVAPGECFGFLGPNGAGKTTTSRMIACSSPVGGGTLLVAGLPADVDRIDLKQRLGVVPQEDNLDTDLTVLENLLVYSRYFDIPAAVARPRCLELLDLFQLADRASARVDSLSGGMKRRLTIARALVNDPVVVILDEPTTGLDPQARHLVWQKLRLLKSRGTTLVLTTHYMDEAYQLCDRLVIMNQGTIIATGAPRDLVRAHAGTTVLEVVDGAGRLEQLRADLPYPWLRFETSGDMLFVYGEGGHSPAEVQDGLPPDTIIRPATLEDVFLRLTGRTLAED